MQANFYTLSFQTLALQHINLRNLNRKLYKKMKQIIVTLLWLLSYLSIEAQTQMTQKVDLWLPSGTQLAYLNDSADSISDAECYFALGDTSANDADEPNVMNPVCSDNNERESEDDNNLNLVLWRKDGSKIVFSLEEKPRIEFRGDKVVFTTPSLSGEYDFEDIIKFTYSNEMPSGIQTIALQTEMTFKTGNGCLTFLPSDKSMNVSIVTANGIVMKSFTVEANTPTSVSLGDMPQGVYLVQVNGVTYKINVR